MELFLSQIGHQVCGVAMSAPEAVALAERYRPDLALLDVRLAEGTDGCDAARTLNQRFGIPSILVTGHLEHEQAREAGVLGLLRKPFDPSHLQLLIEGALRWLRDGLADPPAPGLILPDAQLQPLQIGRR